MGLAAGCLGVSSKWSGCTESGLWGAVSNNDSPPDETLLESLCLRRSRSNNMVVWRIPQRADVRRGMWIRGRWCRVWSAQEATAVPQQSGVSVLLGVVLLGVVFVVKSFIRRWVLAANPCGAPVQL